MYNRQVMPPTMKFTLKRVPWLGGCDVSQGRWGLEQKEAVVEDMASAYMESECISHEMDRLPWDTNTLY